MCAGNVLGHALLRLLLLQLLLPCPGVGVCLGGTQAVAQLASHIWAGGIQHGTSACVHGMLEAVPGVGVHAWTWCSSGVEAS
jgi:hypothetical protein